MMTLKQYFKTSRMSQTNFAKMVGISDAYVSDLKHGKRTPGLCVALKIERLTKGRVPVSIWGEEQ